MSDYDAIIIGSDDSVDLKALRANDVSPLKRTSMG